MLWKRHRPRSIPPFARLRLVMRYVLVISVAMVLLIFTPRIVMAVAVMHLALLGAVLAIRIDAVRLALGVRPLRAYDTATGSSSMAAVAKEPSRPFVVEPPRGTFVSIHVPVADQPSHAVSRTLVSLARLEHRPLEIVVVPHGTQPTPEWLTAQCRQLGPQFRVAVRSDSSTVLGMGAALNTCLRMSSPHADWICTFPVGSRARPGLVAQALEELRLAERFALDPRAVGHVRLAQEASEPALGSEVYAAAGARFGAVLPAGAAPLLLRREALEAVGGWRDRLDGGAFAELGVRLWAGGWASSLGTTPVAAAAIPHSLPELVAARRRLVAGQMHALVALVVTRPGFRALLRAPRASLMLLAQLTAGFEFLLLPCAILAGLALTGVHSDEHAALGAVAAVSALAALAVAIGLELSTPIERSPGSRWQAVAGRLALSWEGAAGWWLGWRGRAEAPRDTARTSGLGQVTRRLLVACALGFTAPLLMLHGVPLGALAMLLVAGGLAIGMLVLHRAFCAALQPGDDRTLDALPGALGGCGD